MGVNDKLVAGLRSYASLRLLTQVLSWIGTIYVVRRVGTHALGQYAVASAVFSYLATAFDGTLLEAVVQSPPSPAQRRATFSVVVGIGFALAGLAVAASGAVGRLIGDEAVSPLVIGVAAAVALMSFGVLPQAVLARQMAFPRLAGIAATQSLCVTLTTVVLAALGAGAWALLWGLVVGTIVRVTLLNASSWSLMWPTARIAAAAGYLRIGGLLLADNLLWRWYTSIDTFLLGRWAGTASLGYYNLAQQVAELPLEKVSSVVNDVSLPAYAELRDRTAEAAQLLKETIRSHAAFGFAIFWGLAAVAAYAVPVLFGSRWNSAVFPLVALSLAAPFRLIGSIETPAMTGLGRPEVLIKTKLITAPVMTVALIIGCRYWGIEGAAVAWLLVFPLCHGFTFRYVLSAARIRYGQVLAVMRGPASAAALMVAVVLAWEHRARTLGPPVFTLVSSIGVGALAYGLGLRWLDPGGFRLMYSRIRLIGAGRDARAPDVRP